MKIERTILILGAMLMAMCLILSYDGYYMWKASQVKLTDNAKITSSTVTSLTNVSFSVDGVYRDESNTQALIILSGDLSKVSYSADTYQVFASGEDMEGISGGLYVFGSLNKLCVFLTNADGFQPAITSLVIRSNVSTGEKKAMNAAYTNMSISYSQYDQMLVKANFGASGALDAKSFLTDAGLDVESLATYAFAAPDDKELRAELEKLQTGMVAKREQIASIRNSLGRQGISKPTWPEWCMSVDGTSDSVETREDGTKYIKTGYIIPGFADFDWQSAKKTDNYATLAGVNPDDLDLNMKDTTLTELQTGIQDWYYEDNSIITSPNSQESSLMSQYNKAMLDYRTAKWKYQKAVATLILTQNDYYEGITSYTSNVGADVINVIENMGGN